MAKARGSPKGEKEQNHGHHGKKTNAAIAKEAHSGKESVPGQADEAKMQEGPLGKEPDDGHHRLNEHRAQHDDHEKASEKTRLKRELKKKDLPVSGDTVNGGE